MMINNKKGKEKEKRIGTSQPRGREKVGKGGYLLLAVLVIILEIFNHGHGVLNSLGPEEGLYLGFDWCRKEHVDVGFGDNVKLVLLVGHVPGLLVHELHGLLHLLINDIVNNNLVFVKGHHIRIVVVDPEWTGAPLNRSAHRVARIHHKNSKPCYWKKKKRRN